MTDSRSDPDGIRASIRAGTEHLNPVLVEGARHFLKLFAERVEEFNKTWAPLDLSRLSAQLGEIGQRLAAQMQRDLRRSLDPLALNSSLLPPALREFAEDLDAFDIVPLVVGEGLPLGVVPRASIARSLAVAQSPSVRRQVIGRNYDRILADCEEQLAAHPPSLEWSGLRRFTSRAVAACQAGHHEAGQSLLASVLDTVVVSLIPNHHKGRVLNSPKGSTVRYDYSEELEPQALYAWIPAWHAYARFDPRSDDGVPRSFSRHASAHAVSRSQYSKRNAAWAALVLTNLLVALELGRLTASDVIEAAEALTKAPTRLS